MELLVTVSIMAILVTLTFAAFTRTADADRVRSAARQLQSYLEGARNRAIYAKEPRGVRFLLDPETTGTGVPQVVSSMVFVGAPGKYTTGTIQVDDSTTPPTVVHALDPNWQNLINRRLLSSTPRIKLIINASTSEYLHISRAGGGTGNWQFTKPPTVAYTTVDFYQYELELLPAVLPNQEPRLLASEISIDLGKSVVPVSWGAVNSYSSTMDVMFSPRGTIIGDVASTGLVHFFLADNVDLKQGRGGVVLNPAMPPTSYVDMDILDTSGTAQLDTEFDAAKASQYRVILRSQGSNDWYIRQLEFVEFSPGLPATSPMPIGIPYRVHFSPDVPANYFPQTVRIELVPERKSGDERVVTLTPQTGNISTHEVDQEDTFSLARSGAVAK